MAIASNKNWESPIFIYRSLGNPQEFFETLLRDGFLSEYGISPVMEYRYFYGILVYFNGIFLWNILYIYRYRIYKDIWNILYIYRIYIDISIPPLNPWVGVFPMRFAGAGRVDPSDRRWCAGMGVLEIWRLAN